MGNRRALLSQEDAVAQFGKFPAAALAIYRGRLRDALVRRARLLAEPDGKTAFPPPRWTDVDRFQLTDIEPTMEQQRILMRVRHQTRNGEISHKRSCARPATDFYD